MELSPHKLLNKQMRRVVILLLIAMLPLRGWATEAMAVSMAVQQLVAIDGSDLARKTLASPSEDCPMQTGTIALDDGKRGQKTISPFCKACTSCQLCMALTTGPSLGVKQPGLATFAPVAIDADGFTSAELTQGYKPPIA
jgi:hypothetical protein